MKLVIFIVACVGCMKHSDKYCAMHPEDTANCAGEDASGACLGNDDCIAIDPTKPVCSDDRTCVECTVEDAALCTEGRVCGGNRMCGDCTLHAECTSSVCQANGRCADSNSVAYVSESGSGSDCTQSAPCNDMSVAEGKAKAIIKVSGTITDTNAVVFDARATTIYADPGAGVTRNSPGNIIEITNTGTELAIYGLRIFGGSGGGTSNGIFFVGQGDPKLTLDRVLIDNNDGSGVRASDGGDVTITRSIIALNTGSTGVVMINNKFSITNTVIAGNGKTALMSSPGGANLQPIAPSRFEFNTVADNVTSGGTTAFRGINCMFGFDIANNLIIGNEAINCDSTYTMFSPGDLQQGIGNMEGDPMFKSITAPASPTYYRITPSSPAKDMADAAATLAIDIDGNMRPIDGRSDIGADEVAP